MQTQTQMQMQMQMQPEEEEEEDRKKTRQSREIKRKERHLRNWLGSWTVTAPMYKDGTACEC